MTPAPSEGYRDVPVAVLGASGFIGRWVARTLRGGGARLILPSRAPDALARLVPDLAAGATIPPLDLTAADGLREMLAATRPAITFNLAGYGVNPAERDEDQARAINSELPEELAAAIARLPHDGWGGQRLVHVGSALEYGEAAGDLGEDTTPRPTTLYGRTKLAGTLALARMAQRTGLRAVTARAFMVYGPGERAGRLLPSLIASSRTSEEIRLTSGEQRRDFTYVEDLAEGLLRLGLSESAPGAVVNVATGVLTSVRAFVERAADVLGIARERLRFGALPTRMEEMRHDPVRVERLRQLTGWAPSCSIEEGVRRTVEAGS